MATYKQYTNHKGTFWELRAFLGRDDSGQKKELQKRGFKTKKEAEDYYLDTLVNLRLGKEIAKTKQTGITFQQVYEEWLEIYLQDVEESTALKTKVLFEQHILPNIGKMPIKKIKFQRLQKLANQWAKQFKQANKVFGYMARVFRYAVIADYLHDNPCDKVIKPKINKQKFSRKRDKSFYTRDELRAFLAGLKEDHNVMWYTFFRLMSYTGVRRGEALALTWLDVNFIEETLTINKSLAQVEDPSATAEKWQGRKRARIMKVLPPKNKKTRVITLDGETLAILKQWKTEQAKQLLQAGYNALNNEQLLFSALKNNSYLTPSQPRKQALKNCERHNLPFINIHGFRHTHASLLFEAGASMKEVQERLGHSNISMTMDVYTHVTQARKTKTAQTFVKFMNS